DGTGLYFYRARYYDPVLKRFISEDPIGTMAGLNLHAYVSGSPMNAADPLGMLRMDTSLSIESLQRIAATNDALAFQNYIGAGAVIGALAVGTATAIVVAVALAPEVAAVSG